MNITEFLIRLASEEQSLLLNILTPLHLVGYPKI